VTSSETQPLPEYGLRLRRDGKLELFAYDIRKIVHPDYFRLTGGLERWLYRIASSRRKSANAV
jgi:Replication initiator protein A